MTRFVAAEDGLVAIEFGIVVSVLVPLLLATADIGQYLHRRMQVEGVAVSAARLIAHTCATTLPVTTNCSSLDAIAADGLSVASLGNRLVVTFDEGEYCVVGGRLERIGDAGRGSACASRDTISGTAAGSSTAGDYLVVTATYTVEPLLLGKGVGEILPEKIVRTSMRRLQ